VLVKSAICSIFFESGIARTSSSNTCSVFSSVSGKRGCRAINVSLQHKVTDETKARILEDPAAPVGEGRPWLDANP
jgi:hypothetical protein